MSIFIYGFVAAKQINKIFTGRLAWMSGCVCYPDELWSTKRFFYSMKTNKPCYECQTPTTGEHHVVPTSLGGTKTVPLCPVCHGKVHNADFLSMKTLSKLGLERKKKELALIGKKLGTNNLTDEHRRKGSAISHANRRTKSDRQMREIKEHAKQLKQQGWTYEAIAEEFNKLGIKSICGKQFWGNTISRFFRNIA